MKKLQLPSRKTLVVPEISAAPVFGPGTFTVGCNYWASHAGCFMWRDWRPEIVEQDFARLAELGLKWLRIFPLWPDFQPLSVHYGQSGEPRFLAWKGELSLPTDGTLTDPVMLERLRFVCDCAQKHGMKLIVALVTGWMSGRLFVPPAFESRNVLTDPEAVYHEIRLIREIVGYCKDHPAVAVWEPGNESNCMGPCSRDEARLWLETIAAVIRQADPSRPLAAGMHGLTPAAAGAKNPGGAWLVNDVGAACDWLTTHPYPAFTPYAGTDRLGSFKSLFHATAESLFYADLSGKPCFAEELGTLSGVCAGERVAAEYLQGTLQNLLFHDCRALFWWCAFDQSRLPDAPYRWCAVERELGLFRPDGSLKPVGGVLAGFPDFAARLPETPLPPFQRDAVVILTDSAGAWGAAWGAFLLAKQAHFDVEFRYAGQPLPDRALYLVPAVSGLDGIPPELFAELERRAAAGATVFVSSNGAMFSPFGDAFGVESEGCDEEPSVAAVEYGGETLTFRRNVRLHLAPTTAEVVVRDSDGIPVLTRRAVGEGDLWFFALPLELEAVSASGATAKGYFRIYATVGELARLRRPLQVASPFLSVTIHPVDEARVYAVAVNNGSRPEKPDFTTAPGWRIAARQPGDFSVLPPRAWTWFELRKSGEA